ncbi:MAG: flagellar basal body L-ring protein FlgH [Candidatus Caldatribacteriaceae bacterium]
MRVLIWGIILVLAFASGVEATSLWTDDGWFSDPYGDQRASKVGDVVTVLIEENTKGNNTASSSGENNTSIALEQGEGLFDFLPSAKFGSSSSRKNNRSYRRDIVLQGVITCQVVEVLENGNLKIAGRKEIFLNKERETVYLEGIISPRALSAYNTVSSTQVLDAVIRLEGTLKPKQRSGLLGVLEGIFGSIMDILF